MIRVAVAGIGGRMGSRIARLVLADQRMVLTGGFEHPDHPAVGEDVSSVLGGSAQGIRIAAAISAVGACDVVIDFTNAAASLENLRWAASEGVAMVIGSTGFSEDQLAEARRLSGAIACVLAPNMSVGVNVLFKVVGEVARLLGDGFDVEIVEAHHRFKKDAPSGTALKLGEIVAQALGRDWNRVGVFARHGLIGERSGEEIGIQTVRAGDIVGEHTVMFGGMGERIEITHRAHSRDNFANGAVRAARWVVQQPAGLYDMQHVLEIK